MQSVLDPTREPSRFLTKVYILALGILAVLTMGSHMIIVKVTESQKDTAEIVYIAGRQRVTAQQIALHAVDYYRLDKEEDKNKMDNAVFAFGIGHRYLIQGKEDERGRVKLMMSPDLYEIYFKPPHSLDQQVRSYMEAAKKFSSFPADKKNDPERIKALDTITQLATGPLINSLDRAAQQYQEETLTDISRLSLLQLGVSILILGTLLLEAAFIFRPLVNHVKIYSQQLLQLAMHDPLTGLHNRRAFLEHFETELKSVAQSDYPFCVVIADIDKFKDINDTYGHAMGDRVIKHFAHILKKSLRSEDIVGRIGGEEFAFVLLGMNPEIGFNTVERIRKMVEETPCSFHRESDDGSSPMLHYTVSFGIIATDVPDYPISELMKWADKALYEAKHGGRNRVVHGQVGAGI